MCKTNRWVIVFVLYLASIVTSLNQFKVSPVAYQFMKQFQANEAVIGLMFSVFAVVGLVLVFPGAIILRKAGPLTSGLVSLGCLIVGSVIGAVANSITVILIGRVIEGASMALIGVICSTVIAGHFRQEASTPMSFWSTWYPIGATLGLIVAAFASSTFGGWRSAWWAGTVLAAIAFILYAIFVRAPQSDSEGAAAYSHEKGQNAGRPGPSPVSIWKGIKNAKVWMLGLAFCVLMLGNTGFMSFASQYLMKAFHMSQTAASSISSIGFLASLPGGLIAGAILKKLSGKSHMFVIICAVLAVLVYPFGFILPQSLIVVYLILLGLINGFACAVIMSMVPRIIKVPYLIGPGMSIIFFCQTLGGLLAGPLVGALIASGGFDRVVVPILIVQCVGVVFAIIAALIKDKDISMPAGSNAAAWGHN